VVDFDGPVDLYHFYLLRAVGKGAFGKVRVVQHKQTKVRHPASQQGRAGLRDADALLALAESLCAQVHQQGQVRQDAGGQQHHPGAASARGNGEPLHLQLARECRAEQGNSSGAEAALCSTRSKTTRTCSWCST
jgi:hypothetical protein